MSQRYKVIVVGAGPGGLAAAIECQEMGMSREDILILEKGSEPADAIRKFYPEKKMTLANYKGLPTETLGHLPCFPDLTKAQTMTYFQELIDRYHLNLRLGAEVVKVSSTDSGFSVLVGRDEIEAEQVVVGIGILGRPNKPAYKLPTSLRNELLFDITSQEVKGKKVLVVGGGDTSSEYCQILEQEGNSVTLVVRGNSLSKMMESNQTALSLLVEQHRVRLFLEMEILEVKDLEGKPSVVFSKPEKMPEEQFDKIIFALGGTTPLNFLRTAGVACEDNWPVVDEFGQTSMPGLYLVGDLVAGKTGGSIITAYNSAFKAAREIVKKSSL
jgi:thioredoxin reductase (NADPH)